VALGAVLATLAGAVPLAAEDAKPAVAADAARDGAWVRFESPTLRFEQSLFAEEARVFLRGPDEVSWRVHRGRDLEAILSVNPDLATRREIVDLQKRLRSSSESIAVGADAAAARVPSTIRTFVEAPGLLLERRHGEALLFVDDASGERAFVGKDLDELARAHPDLETMTGFPTLRARVREIQERKPLKLRSDVAAMVDVRHSDQQVVVTVFTPEDGRWTSRTFRGNTLDEITAREVDLRKVLDLPPTSIQSAGGPAAG
jgi:hypothetical protein